MKNDKVYEYHKIDSYCRSEGLNTDYFLYSERSQRNSSIGGTRLNKRKMPIMNLFGIKGR